MLQVASHSSSNSHLPSAVERSEGRSREIDADDMACRLPGGKSNEMMWWQLLFLDVVANHDWLVPHKLPSYLWFTVMACNGFIWLQASS